MGPFSKQTFVRRTRLVIALSGLAATALTGVAQAQFQDDGTTPPSVLEVGKRPIVKFETETYDMGTVMQIDRPEFVFKFKNAGNGQLAIENVQSSCGCTVPELTKKIYEPGESGEIHVKYDPTGKNGPQHKQIHVFSNDPNRPDISLNVIANVEAVVLIEPKVVTFMRVEKGQGMKQTIKVTGRTEDFAATFATVGNNDIFSVKVLDTKPVEVNGKKLRQTEIEVTLNENARVGRIDDTLSIRTNDPKEPLATCQLTGSVIGELEGKPAVLPFGICRAGQPMKAEMKLANRAGKAFKITSIELKPNAQTTVIPDLAFTSEPNDPANPTVYTIRATGTAPEQATNATFQGSIVVATDVDRETTMEIPFYGQFRLSPAGAAKRPAPTAPSGNPAPAPTTPK